MRFIGLALALAVALLVTPCARACNPAIVTGLRTVAYAPPVSASFSTGYSASFQTGYSANVFASHQFFTPAPSVRVVNNIVSPPVMVAPAPAFTEIRRGGLRGLLFGERITQIR